MRLDPPSAPSTHGAIRGAHRSGNLLIALFRVGRGRQNNPRSHCQRLWGAMSSHELLKLPDFFGA
jgi:hypothetical protein